MNRNRKASGYLELEKKEMEWLGVDIDELYPK